MENRLKEIVNAQKSGRKIGIVSICSANPYVIKAALLAGKRDGSCVLIESTANQCDQFGGYMQMTPSMFRDSVLSCAKEVGLDTDRVFLGGDHLGPLTFAAYNEEKAMQLACELVECYVYAGYTKIHLDTSMRVGDDDPQKRLSNQTIANRTLMLAKAAEAAFARLKKENPQAVHPVYIVGSEVPIPGGQTQQCDSLQVTSVQDFRESVRVFEETFRENGMAEVWKEVIGFVVQPGMEENDSGCVRYERNKAAQLSACIGEYDNLVFEAHSSDYQKKEQLRELVEDGYAILKVGPALTFALREGLFALNEIEEKKSIEDRSDFINILDRKMVENPKYWIRHYHGSEEEIAYKRKYSHCDRCRYYLSDPRVAESIEKLLHNLEGKIEPQDLADVLPVQYEKVLQGKIDCKPESLLLDKVISVIDDYLYGTHQNELF